MSDREFVLTLSCPDSRGIVAAVANLLAANDCNIEESQQYGDHYTSRFFMRVQFLAEDPEVGEDTLRGVFSALAGEFRMDWDLWRRDARPRVLVMVSKFGHCLNDLLYRQRSGLLNAEIVGVVSNHPDLEFLARSYGVEFHHLPVTPENKAEQEVRLLELTDSMGVDLVVLARYMQVLSEDLCQKMSGRIINIHHSFLPSFKGARPYHQAHVRGVKLIGATAHYVTADLDEGPIIEQEVARVDHTYSPEQLTAMGRDLESVALARAVNWHAEHRVLLNGGKTVVFR
ncbi:formyltetrahydrofolate deformylase [Actinorugispora endophytica]|uniref:Formyltetrahydrofolate deformylase n=1 Tax=Actinorugispora endophytica TaxID=1605990 RepID=A0A4R6UM58_9ACTN|nr:formyltetrahydrofolate deformylase [Actinorugispora endophytica]TDQ46619.1 formyltetrahydrofolate deformylase [Actinorugispora endophytica]